MSKDKDRSRSKSKREMQKFRDVISELGYATIGDFIELAGGMAGMLMATQGEENETKVDNVNVMAEQFIFHTGVIIERIGHLDALMARNEDLKQAADEAADKAEQINKAKADAAANPIIAPQQVAPGTILGPDGQAL